MRRLRKAYGGKRKIAWMEVYSGEKANEVYGEPIWLPEETLEAIDEYIIAIKGPLTTPDRRRHSQHQRGAAPAA